MNIRGIIGLFILSLVFASCQKNTTSKIPSIGLVGFGALDKGYLKGNVIKINRDTAAMEFTLADGDADLGNDQTANGPRDIFIKDFRYDTGFVGYYFPIIDPPTIEDPKKGLTGDCVFLFTPYILSPRTDSLHLATGDTTHFEVYIKDRAGNESNHFVTSDIIMVP